MAKDRSYKDDLKIDINSLEVEWENQPSNYIYWAEQEVIAQEERDRLSRNLNLVKAEQDAKIRSKPEKYGIEKVSEGAISARVLRTPEYIKAEKLHAEAVTRAKKMAIAVAAFDHKKRALSKLTELLIAGYYSYDGGVPTNREMSDRIESRKRKEVRGKLKMNKRLLRTRTEDDEDDD